MTGTVLLTGANSSLGIPTVAYLLEHHPDTTLVLTVRNASDQDVNTAKLRKLLATNPKANVSIRELDLARLSAVHEFARTMAADIDSKALPPLRAIVCNAFYWDLVRPIGTTADGFETTIQVNHVSHAALVLRLLGSFGGPGGEPATGRIVLLSSDSHVPGQNNLEKLPPGLPAVADLDLLVKPPADPTDDMLAHGFRRYANSKLAVVMWGHALIRHLAHDAKLAGVTTVIMNPGNLSDSRALRVNSPSSLVMISRVIGPLQPILRLISDRTMRTSVTAGADMARVAVNDALTDQRGYFTMLKPDTSSRESRDEKKQEALWKKTLDWTGVTAQDTALEGLE